MGAESEGESLVVVGRVVRGASLEILPWTGGDLSGTAHRGKGAATSVGDEGDGSSEENDSIQEASSFNRLVKGKGREEPMGDVAGCGPQEVSTASLFFPH